MKRRSNNLPRTIPAAKPTSRAPLTRPPRLRRPPPPPARKVAQIVDSSDKSLVDVLDSLLNQGVVLNAELVLALANVDLVYLRLTALLCAADRVLPRRP
jgi:hypothetical protein